MRCSFQVQKPKRQHAAMNILVSEQCLQIEHATANAAGQHAMVGHCLFEADGVDIGRLGFEAERPERRPKGSLNRGRTVDKGSISFHSYR